MHAEIKFMLFILAKGKILQFPMWQENDTELITLSEKRD